MGTIELGVTITDAAIDDKSMTIFCMPVTRDPRPSGLRARGPLPRHRVPLTDLPVAGYPLVLQVAVPALPVPHR